MGLKFGQFRYRTFASSSPVSLFLYKRENYKVTGSIQFIGWEMKNKVISMNEISNQCVDESCQ